jgi:hypothetical protein
MRSDMQQNVGMKCLAMPRVQSYRDLIVWQKSVELVLEIYRATQNFPKAETYGLVSQLRRAAVSVPSNIVEGTRDYPLANTSNF